MDRNHNACLPAAGRIGFTRAPVACLFGWCNGQPDSPSPTLALGSADHPFGIVAFCDSGRVSPNASRTVLILAPNKIPEPLAAGAEF